MSVDQTNVVKYRVAVNITEYHIINIKKIFLAPTGGLSLQDTNLTGLSPLLNLIYPKHQKDKLSKNRQKMFTSFKYIMILDGGC